MRLKRSQREAPSALPARQPLTPDAAHCVDELLQTAIVRRTTVVLIVAPQFRVEHLLLGFQWRVQMFSTPCGDGEQPAPQALLHRAHMHCEFASPASSSPVREAQEVERGGLGLRPFRLIVGTAAKLHQASLLRMERQAVLRKPLRQNLEYSLRILFELEAQQPIIGIADRERLPSQAWLHLVLEPHIEHMMKVEVGQQRADDLPLTGPCLAREQSSFVHHPNVDPLANQPEDACIAYPPLDHLHELLPDNRVVGRDEPRSGSPLRSLAVV